MTWIFQSEILTPGQIQKVSVSLQGEPLPYGNALHLLQTEPSFCADLSHILASCPFPAFFWETPPITRATAQQQPFEFVLVNSSQLASVHPDPNTFRDYFEHPSVYPGIVTFPNLRGDAQLVVPCPNAELDAYSHLAEFMRQAPEAQRQSLWQTLGKVAEACLSDSEGNALRDRPLWISTSGLGVYWLHIRLDKRPKYYNFAAYKR